ncbi:MAG: toll/interleukin-1 receptor domain-containing protein [Desulfobacteraceae bacterium]|nr:toll/interleukin-1 receptor domain-containing protein [Desulfobacteraceae bacterium]
MKPTKSNIKVFISYAREDYEIALKIYSDLKRSDVKPWLDQEDIYPGENWEKSTIKAIEDCNYFLALLSPNSVSKKGFFQKELKTAFDVAGKHPEGKIFIIPACIDYCLLPDMFQHIQYVNLFPSDEDFIKGLDKILAVMGIKEEPAETLPYVTSTFDKKLSELGKWRRVHNDAYDLYNRLNIPFELLTKCCYKPSTDFLDYAGDKWQGLCVPILKSVSEKISSLQYPSHDIIDSLKQEVANVDSITEKLRIINVKTGEFRLLYFQFTALKNTIFSVMSFAGTKIMVLTESIEITEN